MNCEIVVQRLQFWLRERVEEAGASGVVLGVSGGIDSAVAAVIARRAFARSMMTLLMPCESDINDLIHAQMLVEQFDIPYRIVPLDNAYRHLLTHYESYLKLEGAEGRMLRENIKPRLRMLTLYYSGQGRNYLVLGTSNKSERMVGYSTKYGDSGVDLQLLGDFLKREIYELARFLDIPEVILNKAPSGGLWMEQTNVEEMGFTYEELDDYLEGKQVKAEVIERVTRLIEINQHKNRMPPIPVVDRY